MIRVALYDDPVFRQHDSGRGHPERPERLEAVRKGIRDAGIEGRLRLLDPRAATHEELRRVHTEGHLARVAATAGTTHLFDADTQAGPRSYEAALRAAGALVDAVNRVLDGDIDRAFCCVRPPGHHAESGKAMGFCLFNNVAVAAAQALERGLERVMVVDFDVHHGNGTQEIFYRDPRVLYVSSHAFPFYPGTGALNEVGEGPGRGFTVNLPMPEGLGNAEYTRVYREIVEPIGRAFAPELVLVSAGFDPSRDDPLAGMDVTAEGFVEITAVCLAIAQASARGRTVFALEGGYNLVRIAEAAGAVIAQLLGDAREPSALRAAGAADPLVATYRRHLREHWPILS